LIHDGFELQHHGGRVRLVQAGKSPSVIDALATMIATVDFDTVSRDLDRALASAETDPEDAVTSACSVVESVCRSILIELGRPLPTKASSRAKVKKRDIVLYFERLDEVRKSINAQPRGECFLRRQRISPL
jgi:hypothetical protein